MAYKVVNRGGNHIPVGLTYNVESPGEALIKVRDGRKLFGDAVVLGDDGKEVSDAELKRRMAAGDP